jgi:hypothetical protein
VICIKVGVGVRVCDRVRSRRSYRLHFLLASIPRLGLGLGLESRILGDI